MYIIINIFTIFSFGPNNLSPYQDLVFPFQVLESMPVLLFHKFLYRKIFREACHGKPVMIIELEKSNKRNDKKILLHYDSRRLWSFFYGKGPFHIFVREVNYHSDKNKIHHYQSFYYGSKNEKYLDLEYLYPYGIVTKNSIPKLLIPVAKKSARCMHL